MKPEGASDVTAKSRGRGGTTGVREKLGNSRHGSTVTSQAKVFLIEELTSDLKVLRKKNLRKA